MATPKTLGETMKQNTNWGQIIAICVTIAIAGIGGFNALAGRVSKVEERQKALDDKYDRIAGKIDEMQLDIRQILVNMQNKKDRDN